MLYALKSPGNPAVVAVDLTVIPDDVFRLHPHLISEPHNLAVVAMTWPAFMAAIDTFEEEGTVEEFAAVYAMLNRLQRAGLRFDQAFVDQVHELVLDGIATDADPDADYSDSLLDLDGDPHEDASDDIATLLFVGECLNPDEYIASDDPDEDNDLSDFEHPWSGGGGGSRDLASWVDGDADRRLHLQHLTMTISVHRLTSGPIGAHLRYERSSDGWIALEPSAVAPVNSLARIRSHVDQLLNCRGAGITLESLCGLGEAI